jgi:hypothetical protein
MTETEKTFLKYSILLVGLLLARWWKKRIANRADDSHKTDLQPRDVILSTTNRSIGRARRIDSQAQVETSSSPTVIAEAPMLITVDTTLSDSNVSSTSAASAEIDNQEMSLDVPAVIKRRDPLEVQSLVADILGAVLSKSNNVFVQSSSVEFLFEFVDSFSAHSKLSYVLLTQHADTAFLFGGCRIHDFFRFQEDSALRQQNLKRPRLRETLEHVDAFLVAAIEDVSPETLDAMDWSLRRTLDNESPFGGKRVILLGNAFNSQRKFSAVNIDRLRTQYASTYFYSSESYTAADFDYISADNIGQQINPQDHSILLRAASGPLNDDDILSINRLATSTDQTSIIVVSSPHAADAENNNTFQRLRRKRYEFAATYIEGEHQVLSGLAAQLLTISIGARVLLLNNDPSGSWHRGSTGIVKEIEESNVRVALDGGSLVTVQPIEWTQYTWKYDLLHNQMERVPYARIRQLPISLGYAIASSDVRYMTLHSAHINLQVGKLSSPGELYQVLNSVTSLRNLTVDQKLKSSDFVPTGFRSPSTIQNAPASFV